MEVHGPPIISRRLRISFTLSSMLVIAIGASILRTYTHVVVSVDIIPKQQHLAYRLLPTLRLGTLMLNLGTPLVED